MKRLMICIGTALALAVWLGGAPPALGNLAASANYVLQRGSPTQGIPDVTAPPASANYRLAEGNLGDVSGPAITSAAFTQHPGYLIPLEIAVLRPDLVEMTIRDGRVWLRWRDMPWASYYHIESSSPSPTNYGFRAAVPAGSIEWDEVIPVATSRFYRIQAFP